MVEPPSGLILLTILKPLALTGRCGHRVHLWHNPRETRAGVHDRRPMAAARAPLRSVAWGGVLAVTLAITALASVALLVAQHTVAVVQARDLLARWDLATHLGHGWQDYDLLVTGRIPALAWDLWQQGYWPPALSLYQVPFHLVLGGGTTAALWSSLVAFVLAGIVGCAVLQREWRDDAMLPGSLFLALLMSSPFLLAYASVPMTEMLGVVVQLLVVLTYATYRQDPGPAAARRFAIALTVLFFTKYNYFLLLVAPLVLYELLERTAGQGMRERLAGLWRLARHVLSTPAGAFVVLYLVALLVVLRTGGIEFHLLGQRVSVRSIGNSGHVVLYILLARLWYLHRRGRIHWARLTSADPRVRPLLLWFVIPVTVWMASPYPNHIRDFANLVLNRPLGDSTVGTGTVRYLDALRTMYFYADWVLAAVVGAFVVAAVRYRRQSPLMQWLILTVPLQFAAIALHQTRFPRFLVLTVVLLCLVASSEAGGCLARIRRGGLVGRVLAGLVLAAGVAAARDVVRQPRFEAIAFENYTDDEALRATLNSIRAELNAGERLAIVGESNELSPGLFRWELGPPSGAPCFPVPLAGSRRQDPGLATRILLIEPLGPGSPLDPTSYYPGQRQAVLARVERGELTLRRAIPVPSLHVVFRVYDRTSRSAPVAACR
jgi:hypothetical protein